MLQRTRIGIHNCQAISRSLIRKRFLSTQPPTPQTPQHPIGSQSKINPHSVFYRQFAKPFTKICAISIGTYYSLIFLWEYLEKEAQELDKKAT